MKNKFTLENTKDATHFGIGGDGAQRFYELGYAFMFDERFLINLSDQTGRGYPTLEWFLKCGNKLEAGDGVKPPAGKEFIIQGNDNDNGWLSTTPTSYDDIAYVKSLHDNRHDLTAMARDEYYAKRENQWPNNSRIDVIGQNGNNGEHYPHESESPLSPNFDSFASGQEFFIAQINTLAGLPTQRYYVKQYWCDSGHQREYVDLGIAFDNKTDAERKCKKLLGIDTRTDEEKLRDAIRHELVSCHLTESVIDNLMDKFTITLNDKG